jgi:hypothetical protein
MNLFILSLIQKEFAEYMMDKHISKIILEAVQMLCSALRVLEPEENETKNKCLYKLAHKNHPVTIWCRTSKANFIWVLDLIDCMHTEWKYRYGHPENKMHKSYLIAQYLRENMPSDDKFEKVGLTGKKAITIRTALIRSAQVIQAIRLSIVHLSAKG